MQNPTLLKANVTSEQAEELIEYLYGEFIKKTNTYDYANETILIEWYDTTENVEPFAKWTDTYGNIMISEDFLEKVGF